MRRDALYAVLRALRYGPLREASLSQITNAAKQQSNFLETIRGMQAVKLFNREAQRGVLFQNLAVDTFNAGIRVQKLRMLFSALNGILFGVADIAVVWMGAVLVLDGGFSVGMLFAFLSYKSQFTSRMSALVDNAIEFRMLELHTGRVADIALAEPESPARARRLRRRPLRRRATRRQRPLCGHRAVRAPQSEPQDRGR